MPVKLRIIIFVMLCCFSITECSHEKRNVSTLPNIILCMADDQGWGDMGYAGHEVIRTPNFDSMASEAMRFDHFYAAAPVCSPTRGSVLTGRNPNRFGCYSWGHTIRPQEITIAEVLKDAGYITGHFGKWHLGSVRKGSPVNPGNSGFDEWLSAPNFFDNDPILSREGIAVQTTGESSMVTVEAALKFITENEGKGKPYFAVIWFGSPHLPHQAAEADWMIYDDQPEKLKNFYGEITGMDRAFGKLRAELCNLKSYNNTILWYCSDNGGLPGVGSTGGRGNKSELYEGGLRVPALLEWPAVIREHSVENFPAVTSDIFPTILDIIGLHPEPGLPLDGISLLPLIQGTAGDREKPVGFWQFPVRGISTPSAVWMAELLEAQKEGSMTGDSSRLRLDAATISRIYSRDSLPGHAAWLDWPLKLHRNQDKTGRIVWELYDLEKDSMEQVNLLDPGVNPDKLNRYFEEMKASLESWQRSVIGSMNGEDY